MKTSLLTFIFLFLVAGPARAERVSVKRLSDDGQSGSAAVPSPHDNQSNVSTSERVHVRRQTIRHDSGGAADHWTSERFDRSLTGGRVRVVSRSDLGAPRSHTTVIRNTEVVRNINRQRMVEVAPNHYYWHRLSGARYCHYYGGGIHWYGFYDGPNFYWTRYQNSRWWWHDPRADRWVYWSGGNWWWPGPNGVTLVYVNDSYYPPNESPEPVEAPPAAIAPTIPQEKTTQSWDSPDGRRTVQIFGPQAEAFLYDKSASPARYMAYLGQNVEKVRYSGGSNGQPLKILVDDANGGFTLYSDAGTKLSE